ncbi:MAG TPA: 50S ribosomal protein L19 [bacterium]|nr:50S ribosomal protein L19 [bacterium]
MTKETEIITKPFLKKLPDIRPGDTIKVYQKIKEGKQEKTQVFEGIVLARKHGKGISATITVRKVISGIAVEKIFPLHSPIIEKIEILKRGKTRRAKLYYLREAKGKRARLKKIELKEKSQLEDKATTKITEEKKEKKEEPKQETKKAQVAESADAQA